MAIQSSTSRYQRLTLAQYRHKSGAVVVAMPFRLTGRQQSSGGRAVTTSSGQEFDLLAHSEYGSTLLWWAIADENPHVAWPFDIADGTELLIPSQAHVLGRL